MMTDHEPTTAPALDEDLLRRLFGADLHQVDLREGTTRTPAETRVIYLSTDIIRGIYEALHYEAGEAWSVILKNCGSLWGRQVYAGLAGEFEMLSGKPLSQALLPDYLRISEAYFASHGWGKLTFLLEDATTYGIVRARLTHSLFVNALPTVNGRVDAMLEGMLRGWFESISGREDLDCLEITCARQNAGPHCEFVITSHERIAKITPLVEEKAAPDAILARLREL